MRTLGLHKVKNTGFSKSTSFSFMTYVSFFESRFPAMCGLVYVDAKTFVWIQPLSFREGKMWFLGMSLKLEFNKRDRGILHVSKSSFNDRKIYSILLRREYTAYIEYPIFLKKTSIGYVHIGTHQQSSLPLGLSVQSLSTSCSPQTDILPFYLVPNSGNKARVSDSWET